MGNLIEVRYTQQHWSFNYRTYSSRSLEPWSKTVLNSSLRLADFSTQMSDRLLETWTYNYIFASQISTGVWQKAKVYLENTYQEYSHIVCVNKVRQSQYKDMKYSMTICVSFVSRRILNTGTLVSTKTHYMAGWVQVIVLEDLWSPQAPLTEQNLQLSEL